MRPACGMGQLGEDAARVSKAFGPARINRAQRGLDDAIVTNIVDMGNHRQLRPPDANAHIDPPVGRQPHQIGFGRKPL